MKYTELSDADCAIAQALSVVGDWWTLLVVRDIAGGVTRFDALQRELSVSRKTLTERLKALVEHGVVERRQYSQHPPRFEYHLSDAGLGLLPVLIALQDWGTRHVTGDGSLTATTTPTSAEAARVHGLVGRKIPALTLTSDRGEQVDPARGGWAVLYCFPGAFAPGGQGYPPGWADIPGATGCTLESTTYRDRFADFDRIGAAVHGVSTQRPDQLRAFAEHVDLPFALLSDEDLALAAGLRLPTFRAAGVDRFKRATLIVDPARTVRAVQFPVVDPAESVDEALAQLTYFK
ncbi:winged helix-turn-helix transcriptional regulator [Actinokineospora sp.]|uniref:winged helix-turn-helix transcriptional regulator n=1 Tax=Actinokineospora sp. TaxID=1872133 RepID=UPI003D6A41AF